MEMVNYLGALMLDFDSERGACCGPSSQNPDMSDEHPSHRAFNRGFKVLGKTAASTKLTECLLHNPAALEQWLVE